MTSTPSHRSLAVGPFTVPRPFRAFAVRSDEACHAADARAPYGRVHVVATGFLDAGAYRGLADAGYARVDLSETFAVDYAGTSPADLVAAAPGIGDPVAAIARALQLTGVLGDAAADYERSVAHRIDWLASRGAGFHNDVARHWSRSLFWILALDVGDVEFVLPHAGLRVALAPGDLLVFDPTLAHGLCRPADDGAAVAGSFENGDAGRQLFLTGELPLSDARWAALGSPWLPVEAQAALGALDLMVAEFDERSGAIKRVRALAHCMDRDTCHVELGVP